jgi:hypothetical protein
MSHTAALSESELIMLSQLKRSRHNYLCKAYLLTRAEVIRREKVVYQPFLEKLFPVRVAKVSFHCVTQAR